MNKKPSYTTNEYYFDISNENFNGENSYHFKYLSKQLTKSLIRKSELFIYENGPCEKSKIKCCQYIPKKNKCEFIFFHNRPATKLGKYVARV